MQRKVAAIITNIPFIVRIDQSVNKAISAILIRQLLANKYFMLLGAATPAGSKTVCL